MSALNSPVNLVDAQIHLNRRFGVEETLRQMDALGIQAAVVDEYWGPEPLSGDSLPGRVLPGGVFRPEGPGAEAAARAYPDRFSFLLRVSSQDPDLRDRLAWLGAIPYAHAVRLDLISASARDDFMSGGCDAFFSLAGDNTLPVFVLVADGAEVLHGYARRHPATRIVLDHMGMPSTVAELEDVLRLSELGNVAIKWSHADRFFAQEVNGMPGPRDVLARVRSTFGRERIMWASDFTETPYEWSHHVEQARSALDASVDDLAWMLGKTARYILDWPEADHVR